MIPIGPREPAIPQGLRPDARGRGGLCGCSVPVRAARHRRVKFAQRPSVRQHDAMGSLSAAASLRLPVRLHGIQLGQPTDLLLDVESWHALGFVVHCGDDSVRFLPWAASQPSREEIAVGSALMLLEDVAFYAKRSASFRSLLGGELATRRRLARRADRRRRRGHRARDRTRRRARGVCPRRARGFARGEQHAA